MSRPVAMLLAWYAVATVSLAPPAAAFVEEHMARLTAALDAGRPVDCHACNLSYADLSGLDLTGANLAGAYLSGARLKGTVLRGAILDRADLTRSELTGADFTGASMTDVRATSARWCGTVMADGTVNDSRCD